MGKLGKKARKFAKKNLQSVHKRQRKLKAVFKKRNPSPHGDAAGKSEKAKSEEDIRGSSEGTTNNEAGLSNLLDDIFSEDDDNYPDDISDNDGFLSEDSECPYILEGGGDSEDKNADVALMGQNMEIRMEIAKQKKKLDRLQKKDPKFSEFLESQRADLEQSESEEIYSDDGGTDYSNGDAVGESLNSHDRKVVTSCTIDVWCWLVMEQPNGCALVNLLNAFRTACRYGIDSDECPQRIPNKEVFSKILTFVLHEADGIFRRLLGCSDSCSQESILKLENTSVWKTVGPLVKSYLRSCLFLLNQVTDSQIFIFVLSQLRASTVLFAAFPSLIGRLLKVSVHLWVTGEKSLSLSSFLVIRHIASQLSSGHLEKCLSKTYKAFVAHSKFVQPTNLEHLEFLADCTLELYSLDIQKSYPKVLNALQHLANLLREALKTKKKEQLKKIYNWQYINCINLWVKFIAFNIRDQDLQPLLSLLIEVIRGIAHLFPGPRYVPLRYKCVQMLNQLSRASGVFIPVVSLVDYCLEYKGSSNSDTKHGKPLNFASLLKVPKQLLKSRGFHEGCIHSGIELLSAHLAQWSYHISFPELATIPVILLRRFYEKSTLESLRRPVKRLIDQVQLNSEFIQRKREEVAFSPNDHASVESFHQLEKGGSNASFTQYYASVQQKLHLNYI